MIQQKLDYVASESIMLRYAMLRSVHKPAPRKHFLGSIGSNTNRQIAQTSVHLLVDCEVP